MGMPIPRAGMQRWGKFLNLLIAGISVGVGLFYLYQISQIRVPFLSDPIGAKAFPTLIAIGFFISAILLIIEHFRWPVPSDESVFPSVSWIIVGVTAWTGLYILFFEWLGYIISTAIYLTSIVMYFNRRKFWLNLCAAACFVVISYVGLAVLLGAALPRGRVLSLLLNS